MKIAILDLELGDTFFPPENKSLVLTNESMVFLSFVQCHEDGSHSTAGPLSSIHVRDLLERIPI